MKIGIISILLSIFLIGCGGETRQNIPAADVSEKEREDIKENSTEKMEEKQKKISNENGDKEKQEQYFYLEACEEIVDLKLDLLEKDYKQGEISKTDYRSQKQELEQEENQYQLEREALGYQGYLYEPFHIQDSDKKVMRKRLLEVEEEEEALETKMKKTKRDYIEQKLSQEDFILKRSKQEEEKERLEQEKDWLEKNLNS